MKGVYNGKLGYTTKTGAANIKGLFTDESEDNIKFGTISKELDKLIMESECGW